MKKRPRVAEDGGPWPWAAAPDYQPSMRVRKLSEVGAWFDRRSGWYFQKYSRRWMSPAEHREALVLAADRAARRARAMETRRLHGGLPAIKAEAARTGDFGVLREACGVPASTSDATLRSALLLYPLEDWERVTGAQW
jgi:hypothetical protein